MKPARSFRKPRSRGGAAGPVHTSDQSNPMKATMQKPRNKAAALSQSTEGPENGNHAVHFALNGTDANEVFLAGDFNGWNPAAMPMKHNGDGAWSAEVELAPGRHEYLFVADGLWKPDPAAGQVPNPFGGVNSVIEVAAAAAGGS